MEEVTPDQVSSAIFSDGDSPLETKRSPDVQSERVSNLKARQIPIREIAVKG